MAKSYGGDESPAVCKWRAGKACSDKHLGAAWLNGISSLTVAQVTSYISHLFEEDFALKRISIQGEISNCRKHSGGHLYFTLKDETSTLSCVMFAS